MDAQLIVITLLLAVLGFASYAGHRSQRIRRRWILDVQSVRNNREYDRFLSSCGLHASVAHLVFNAVVIGLYGAALSHVLGGVQMLVVFLGAALGSSLLTYWINRGRRHEALGASGAACGLVCAFTLVSHGAAVAPLPAFVPGWLYALLFLAASYFADGRKKEAISYSAHLGGAIGGILIATLYVPALIRESPHVNWLPLFLLLATRVYFAIWPTAVPEDQLNRHAAETLPDLHLRAYQSELSEYRPNLRYQRYDEKARENHDRRHMDSLLDKISKHGPDALKDWEKRELKRLSRRYRRAPEA
ncbi:MAG: rhomboid family intramembrane serine protease [Verrucomicrobiota bacterium]